MNELNHKSYTIGNKLWRMLGNWWASMSSVRLIAAFRRCPVTIGFAARRTSRRASFSFPRQSAPRPDLPDGCGLEIRVKPGAQKYSCLPKFGFGVKDAHPAPLMEGRIAVVTTRGAGMRWTRRRCPTSGATRTAKWCGPGAPKAGANADDAQAHRGGRWQSARFTGESAYKP